MSTKLKAKAKAYVPQTRDDCAADIAKLGELQRDFVRLQADLNDGIAHLTQLAQPEIDALKERISTLQQGVQSWCEANRDTLTEGGKTKTANLVTGEVSWRLRPPSVSVRGAESVIDTLKRMGLTAFVRTKEEINKEAVLNEPDQVRGIAGLSIVTGQEDFSITPFEQKAD